MPFIVPTWDQHRATFPQDQGTEVFLVTFEPLDTDKSSVGGLDWSYVESEARRRFDECVKEDWLTHRVKFYPAWVTAGWDAEQVTDYLDETFIASDPDAPPVLDTFLMGQLPLCEAGGCAEDGKLTPATHLVPQVDEFSDVEASPHEASYKWLRVCDDHHDGWWDDEEPRLFPLAFRLTETYTPTTTPED